MAIEVSLHLHGTPYGELGWGQNPVADLSAEAIRAYAERLAGRMQAVADVMERLYADGWSSEAQSYELAFTKDGIATADDARAALMRLGIAPDAEFLSVQEPFALGGESSADTYRFHKVIRAQAQGTGMAREGEWVTPSVFAPEMVGIETLMPAARAVVVAHPEGVTAKQFAEEAWRLAHGGPDAPPINTGFVDVVYEFLASVEDLQVGMEVGFQHEHDHAGCDPSGAEGDHVHGHACCENEP